MIRPGLLHERAPTFYETFFDLLENKPDVKARYFEIQQMLHQPREKIVADREARLIAGFKSGEETARAQQEALEQLRHEEYSPSRLWTGLKADVVDLKSPLEEIYDKNNVPEDARYLYMLDETRYLGGKLRAFAEEYMIPIVKAVEGVIGMDAFGAALTYERVISGDRSELANPTGLSPTTAEEQYTRLKEALGPEKAQILETQIGRFRAMVQTVTEAGYESGLYNDAMYKDMQENPAYATFQVVDYMENDLTARVYGQKGTLQDIRNPAYATFMKTLAIIGEIDRNNARRAVSTTLLKYAPSEIAPADVSTIEKARGGVMRLFKAAPSGQGIVKFLNKGVTQGYYLDEYVATAVNYESPQFTNAILKVLTKMNSVWFRPLFTMLNVGFMVANVRRDWSRFYKNNPGMTIGRSIRRYIEAVPMARMRAFGVPENATPEQLETALGLRQAYKSKMFSQSWSQITQGQEGHDTVIDQIRQEAKVPGFEKPAPKPYLKPFLDVIDAIGKIGTFAETLPKAAQLYEVSAEKRARGMALQQAIAEMTPKQRQTLRRDIGSPDFLSLTGSKPWTNNLFLYSHAQLQGIRSDLRVALDPGYPKTMGLSGWWWKTIGVDVLPKVFMVVALQGLLGDELRRFYERVTEYDRTHYTPVPLWWGDPTGPVAYLRVPAGDMGRLIGALTYKTMMHTVDGRNAAASLASVFDLAAGQFPSISPAISTMSSASQMLAGRNPTDYFRDRDILSAEEQEARGWPATKKFLGWSFQNLGGSAFWRFYPGERLPEQRTAFQTFLELPLVSPIAGRFIRVTEYGDTERIRQLQAEERRGAARGRQAETAAINALVGDIQEGRQPSDANIRGVAATIALEAWPGDAARGIERFQSGVIEEKIRVSLLRGGGGPFVNAYVRARTKAERDIALLEWVKALGLDEE